MNVEVIGTPTAARLLNEKKRVGGVLAGPASCSSVLIRKKKAMMTLRLATIKLTVH